MKLLDIMITTATLLGLSANALSAEQLYDSAEAPIPALAAEGEYGVGVRTIDVTNKAQLDTADFNSKKDRKLTLELWYPTPNLELEQKTSYDNETRTGIPFSVQGNAIRNAAFDDDLGKFPLVIISHGYTGYRTMMFYLAEHLASHGYVVAGIDHTDSTNIDVDFSKNAGAGFPSTLYNRARDQQFVLDYLADTAPFTNNIDSSSASIIGYSMGGYGAINTAGGCYNFSAEKLEKLGFTTGHEETMAGLLNSCNGGSETTDPRWKSLITFAPWGGIQGIFDEQSLQKITIPSLFIGGDLDSISGYEDGVKKLYSSLGAKDKYFMVYKNAHHNTAPHPAPDVALNGVELDSGHYVEPNWDTQTINHINEHMVLAFLNSHVKSDKDSSKYLPQRELSAQSEKPDGQLESPWPGFPENWGAGVRFIRGNP
jgi:predicted dienelactone hydrolase